MEYINKNVYGEFELSGAIFLSCLNKDDFSDPYNLVYGHNMKNGGMFADVADFTNKEYFETHQKGKLYLTDATRKIRFFACMKVTAADAKIYHPDGYRKENLKDLLDYIQANAVQYRDVNVADENFADCFINVLGGRDEWSCSSDREIREEGGRKTVKILRYRSVKKIAAAGVMLFMWIGSTMAVPVYAGTPNVEIQIPVSVQGAAGTIVLEPEKAGIPVPDRTELQIGKDEKQSFGPICYEEPEDYHYKIYQKSANVTDVTYDTAVYDVTVRVTGTEAGELEAVVWCEKEGTEGKSDEIIFTNSGKEQAPEIAPTGKTAIYRNYPVKTGDVAPMAVLAAMSGISAGVLTAVERWKRKKKIRESGRTGQAGVRDLFFFD